jgi:hypothetical protein
LDRFERESRLTKYESMLCSKNLERTMKVHHKKLKVQNRDLSKKLENRKADLEKMIIKQIRKSSKQGRRKRPQKILNRCQSFKVMRGMSASNHYTTHSTKFSNSSIPIAQSIKEAVRANTPSFGEPILDSHLCRTLASSGARMS